MTTRRRFLTISAGLGSALAFPRTLLASPPDPTLIWRGAALGAATTIAINHPYAERYQKQALAEITRLEDVFSLYRAQSQLSRLNRTGTLAAPAPELLSCLSLAGLVHDQTGGLFDPTIQPLWSLYAESYAKDSPPTEAGLKACLQNVDWPSVRFSESAITLRPGMALTLNGIAQGYIADVIASALREAGLENVLVDTGELCASGNAYGQTGWPVRLANGRAMSLENRALASSAPRGTVFDRDGAAGHIIDPRTGKTAQSKWSLVSVSSPHAAVADALSTAGCLCADRETLERAVLAFPGARIEAIEV